MKLQRILLGIAAFLLVCVWVAGQILVSTLEQQIPELDYTIYDVTDRRVYEVIEDGGWLGDIISAYFAPIEEDTTEYKYKFYRKMTFVAFCGCEECQRYWKWEPTPKRKRPIEGTTIAANPQTLAPNAHIQTEDGRTFTVHYISEDIPKDKLYVYLEDHKTVDAWYEDIHDIYRAK